MTEEVKAKAAKAKAPKAKAKAEATEAPKPMGRKPSPEVEALMNRIVKLSARKGGISNIELATELEITTLQASALSRRLIKQERMTADKAENGRVTYNKVV